MAFKIRRSTIAAGVLLGTALAGGLYILDSERIERNQMMPPAAPENRNEAQPTNIPSAVKEVILNEKSQIQSYFGLGLTQERSEAQSVSGAFLSSLFAQRRQQWGDAANYIADMRGLEGGDVIAMKKSMVLEMGANNAQASIDMANKVLLNSDVDYDRRALAHLFVAVGAFHDGDYERAQEAIDTMPDDGLTLFMKPVIEGWLRAVDGRDYPALRKGHHIHVLSAAFIADYLKQQDNLKDITDQLSSYDDLPLKTREKIADIYRDNGFVTEAKRDYKMLHDIIPSLVRLKRKAEAKSGAVDGKLMLYSAPASANEGLAYSIYEMASMLQDDGAYDSGRIFVNLALYLDPALNEALMLQASIAVHFKNYQKALGAYEKIASGSAYYGEAKRRAAAMYQDAGKLDQAIKHLRDYYQASGDMQALLQIGDTQRADKRFADALHSYNMVVDRHLDGKVPRAYWFLHYVRGQVLERMGRWEEARQELEQALKHHPKNPFVLNYLGYAMADRGIELERALDMLKQAIRLEPNDGAIVDSLGWVYYKLGQYKRCVPFLERASELMPSDPVINDHLGDAYWQVGRKLEARYQWKRARMAADIEPSLRIQLDKKLNHGLQNTHLVAPQEGKNDETSDDKAARPNGRVRAE